MIALPPGARDLCLVSAFSWLEGPLHPQAFVANAGNFPQAFRGLFAAIGDTPNRDYSGASGWNTPKCEYRRARQSEHSTIEEI
jgi:hypothetical protein